MDKLENKHKVAGAGIVVAGVALLWYLLTRDSKTESKKDVDEPVQQKETKEEKVTEQKNEASSEPKYDQVQELEKFVQQFRVEYVEGTEIINLNTLQQIMNISVKLSIQEYQAYTIANRRDRRQKKSEEDDETYF